MGLLSLNLPVIGQSSATEDQKVRDALAAIQTDYNGNLTDANISASAGIQESKLASGATGMARGYFSAYRATNIALATNSVIPFDTEEDDVSGWFDTATNVGRFTPQAAGYYEFCWSAQCATVLATDVVWFLSLSKNGTRVKVGQIGFQRPGTTGVATIGTAKAKANGTTDFFEIILTHTVGAAATVLGNQTATYFQGSLIGRS